MINTYNFHTFIIALCFILIHRNRIACFRKCNLVMKFLNWSNKQKKLNPFNNIRCREILFFKKLRYN